MHHWLCEISKDSPFPVATTEAPHFRRVALTRLRARGIPLSTIEKMPVGRGFGIRDGNGIMFISHTGSVYPSGFLPLSAGNVRSADVVDLYRNSNLFRSLRLTRLFKGNADVASQGNLRRARFARLRPARDPLQGRSALCL